MKEIVNITNVSVAQLKGFFAKGRFATVVFVKKDGSDRVLNGKSKVMAALRGGEATYDAESRGQVRVADVNIYKNGIRETGYRAVTAERVKEIRANGKIYRVTTEVAKPTEFISNISSDGKNLSVSLSGRDYCYFDVPKSVVEGFVNAESKGIYFNQNIKGKYDFVRLA